VFDFFDKVYVIHLPNTERREHITKQLDRFGVKDFEFIYAEQPRGKYPNMRRRPAVEMGCNLSHIKAVVRAMHEGAERPLFLEDDVVFSADAKERAPKALAELPPDWAVVYFGGHPRGSDVRLHGDNLVRVNLFSFAESYSIRGDLLIQFFDYWCDRIGRPDAMYDFILGEFAGENGGYCAFPTITEQAEFISHISGKRDHRENLLLNGWMNCWAKEN